METQSNPRKNWNSAVPPVSLALERLEQIDIRLGFAPGGHGRPAFGRLPKDLLWQRRWWQSRLRDALRLEGFRAPTDPEQ